MAGENREIQKLFKVASEIAKTLNSNSVETEHLLYSVISNESSMASKVLCELGVNKSSFAKILRSLSKNTSTNNDPVLSKNVSLILSRLSNENANTQDALYLLLSK